MVDEEVCSADELAAEKPACSVVHTTTAQRESATRTTTGGRRLERRRRATSETHEKQHSNTKSTGVPAWASKALSIRHHAAV